MILAGDIGGTKTLLGLFEAAAPRPRPVVVRTFSTLDFEHLAAMLAAFSRGDGRAPIDLGAITAACFGVAGPVVANLARLTNIPWIVDGRSMADLLGIARVQVLNDLEALAHALPVLQPEELHTLQEGEADAAGNIALLAAGTGLGEVLLHNVSGRFVPAASEAGHADFAARTEREIALVRQLTAQFGRVEVERVVSGRGLTNIHRAVHEAPCAAGIDASDAVAPAAISQAATTGTCASCREALDIFIDAYGAEAGNLALRTLATGGVFVGGGIAPKILSSLTNGPFLRAFRAKAPFEALLEKIPVQVILNAEAGLLGAAVCGMMG